MNTSALLREENTDRKDTWIERKKDISHRTDNLVGDTGESFRHSECCIPSAMTSGLMNR